MMRKLLSWSVLILASFSVQAFELATQKVTDNIYALVGETGPVPLKILP